MTPGGPSDAEAARCQINAVLAAPQMSNTSAGARPLGGKAQRIPGIVRTGRFIVGAKYDKVGRRRDDSTVNF